MNAGWTSAYWSKCSWCRFIAFIRQVEVEPCPDCGLTCYRESVDLEGHNELIQNKHVTFKISSRNQNQVFYMILYVYDKKDPQQLWIPEMQSFGWRRKQPSTDAVSIFIFNTAQCFLSTTVQCQNVCWEPNKAVGWQCFNRWYIILLSGNCFSACWVFMPSSADCCCHGKKFAAQT